MLPIHAEAGKAWLCDKDANFPLAEINQDAFFFVIFQSAMKVNRSRNAFCQKFRLAVQLAPPYKMPIGWRDTGCHRASVINAIAASGNPFL